MELHDVGGVRIKDRRVASGDPLIDCDVIDMYVRMNLDKIIEINDVKQTFKAQYYFEASTRVPTADKKRVQEVRAFLEKFTDPNNLVVENMVEPLAGPPSKPKLEEKMDAKGATHKMSLTWKIAGEFSECLEHQRFPFDCQDLTLTLCFWNACREDKLQFRFIDSKNSSVILHNFHLGNTWTRPFQNRLYIHTEFTNEETHKVNKKFPLLKATVQLQRIPSFYMCNILLPMFALVCLSAASMAIPNDLIGDRLSTSVMLILTAVAFKFIIAQMVPKIGYNTGLDWYVLVCWFFLGLIVAENCLATHHLHNTELVVAVIIYFGFATANVFFAIKACYSYFRPKSKLTPLLSSCDDATSFEPYDKSRNPQASETKCAKIPCIPGY
ncbi:unnamed protein product [Symbiodinium necroappetens]|uniref:Neurotransmitter-gated ion-channel transmembrane domain-containing protein n=1 Tax=Symbiodinium necroappetens TaxID=1628268 RepID=A0A812X5S0_9DINO|nr:unnamed protein product [Symbiodinium necroappetens]